MKIFGVLNANLV